ncbi:MAG TPA: LysR family transcriptional regulator [Desulfitobacterium dehalogenans]|uniref:LysR family transcriptional regulator n=1 Tax=Desulfitobacterium dehalogenans TaxID=36854 RepID=A0A7C6Z2B2_9FIRM|nr:LysR family transcriptional regulator [Desulfitobacterium dehalogenans]
MELRQLKTFVKIAEVNSFVKAGKILNYSQPTMTTHIQSLEKELKYKLFQRLGREVTLTSEGKHFLLYAKRILNLCQEATQRIESGTLAGKLTIGTSEAFGILRLPAIIKEFRLRYPDVSLEIKFKYMDELFEDLKKNEIDLAFVLCQKVNHPNLTAEILAHEPLTLVAAPENFLVQKEKINLMDFSEQNIILTQRGCAYRAAFEELLKKLKTPPIIMGVNNLQAIKHYTMSNLGITLLPHIYVEKELKTGTLCKLPWQEAPFNMSSQLVYHKDKWHSSTMSAFLKIVREYRESQE